MQQSHASIVSSQLPPRTGDSDCSDDCSGKESWAPELVKSMVCSRSAVRAEPIVDADSGVMLKRERNAREATLPANTLVVGQGGRLIPIQSCINHDETECNQRAITDCLMN